MKNNIYAIGSGRGNGLIRVTHTEKDKSVNNSFNPYMAISYVVELSEVLQSDVNV